MDPSLGKRENVLFSLCSSLGPIVKWYYAARRRRSFDGLRFVTNRVALRQIGNIRTEPRR